MTGFVNNCLHNFESLPQFADPAALTSIAIWVCQLIPEFHWIARLQFGKKLHKGEIKRDPWVCFYNEHVNSDAEALCEVRIYHSLMSLMP